VVGFARKNTSVNLTFVSAPPFFSPISYRFRSLGFLLIVIDERLKAPIV